MKSKHRVARPEPAGSDAIACSWMLSRAGLCVGLAALAGCQSAPPAPPPAAAVTYRDIGSQGLVAGLGTESQDIVSVTDAMVRDLLSSPIMGQFNRPPRILVDAEGFRTDGVQRINKELIVDRLRINLQRAAKGRLHFVSREATADVARERDLKDAGITDRGTNARAAAVAGVDYLMRGKMLTQDKRSASNGAVERYTQFSFELIDAQNQVSVWANLYEMQKGGRDDAVYR